MKFTNVNVIKAVFKMIKEFKVEEKKIIEAVSKAGYQAELA